MVTPGEGDAPGPPEEEVPTAEEPSDADEGSPPGFDRWRRESALGAVGTGIARGLQNVFAPPQDQPVMVAPVPGGPPDPDRLQVVLDPDDPSKSVAIVPPPHAEDDPSSN